MSFLRWHSVTTTMSVRLFRSGTPPLPRGQLFTQLKQSRRPEDVERLLGGIGALRTPKEWRMAISAWGRSMQWERALELLARMEACEGAPDVFSYSAAISACGKGRQWERAVGLLSQMEARGGMPNVISYSAAISACEKSQQWERAIGLLLQM